MDPASDQPHNGARHHFDDDLTALHRRLIRLATTAIGMLEDALESLRILDVDSAKRVRKSDSFVDAEEVEIEAECMRLMTLQQPFGTDFRMLAFCLKVNEDIERVADHASSIAKVTIKLADIEPCPLWPTALTELAERVPLMCHGLLRAVLDRDADAARQIVAADKTIDRLDRNLFDEIVEWVVERSELARCGLHTHRVGRELERVADLMCNIAEDVVYLVTGEIIRHTKIKKKKQ